MVENSQTPVDVREAEEAEEKADAEPQSLRQPLVVPKTLKLRGAVNASGSQSPDKVPWVVALSVGPSLQ